MNDQPQMTDLPAEMQAAKAIQHTLRIISDNAVVAYHCGHGTQTYSLLTEAHATLHGITKKEAQENWPPARQKELQTGQKRDCPFCGGGDLNVADSHFGIRVNCLNCDLEGPPGENEAEALEKWNGRAIQRL